VDQVSKRLEERKYEVVRVGTDSALARYSRRLEIPAAFTDSVLAGKQVTVTLTRSSEGMSANYDQIRVARAVYTVLADVVVAGANGGTPGAAAFDTLAALPRALRLEARAAGKRKVIPAGFEQTIPGTMVMFTILVLLTSGAVLLVVERQQGLLRRLASTPMSREAVVLGKWGGRMALALVQIAFAMAAGTILFRMRWGTSLPMVFLVLVAWGALNASLGLLLGAVARSAGQAVGVGVLAAQVLGALGGCWWPIEVTPRWMQTFALFLPTGWAMDAMHRLVSFDAGWQSGLPHLLGISVAALVTGWAAVRAFRFH
jgi:ABC-type multidrug transport system permease subunit